MDFLSKLLQGIAFVPSIVTGIEGLFASRSGVEKKNAAMSFVSAALQLTRCGDVPPYCGSGKIQAGIERCDRWHGFVLERFHLGEADPAVAHPTSSLQFSSAFLTSAMNWSATAPSMMRWS